MPFRSSQLARRPLSYNIINGNTFFTPQSGAKINISDGSCPERIVTVSGSTSAIYKAFTLITKKFEEVSCVAVMGGLRTNLRRSKFALPANCFLCLSSPFHHTYLYTLPSTPPVVTSDCRYLWHQKYYQKNPTRLPRCNCFHPAVQCNVSSFLCSPYVFKEREIWKQGRRKERARHDIKWD